MKKKYQQPLSIFIELHTEHILAGSGDFGGSGDDIEINRCDSPTFPWKGDTNGEPGGKSHWE